MSHIHPVYIFKLPFSIEFPAIVGGIPFTSAWGAPSRSPCRRSPRTSSGKEFEIARKAIVDKRWNYQVPQDGRCNVAR